MKPTVSVVTCTYNRAHLIGETIQSVLNQTFQDFEYIIVDDGSTDDTKKVVESFRDARIKYFYVTRTGGHLSKLRNLAYSKCSGEYLAYIDSDDLWLNDKIERQIQFLRENIAIGFSFTGAEIFSNEITLKKNIYQGSGQFCGSVFRDLLHNKIVIYPSTWVVRKSCFDKTGLADESLICGDHDFVFFLSCHFDAHLIYQTLTRIRKHNQNTSSDSSMRIQYMKEHHHTLKKLADRSLISSGEYREALSQTNYSFGIQLLATPDSHLASRYFRSNILMRPWHLKGWIRLLLSLTKKTFRF